MGAARRRYDLAMLLVLLLACAPQGSVPLGGKDAVDGEDSAAPPPPPTPMLALDGASAFDPRLSPAVELRVAQEHGDTVRAEVIDASGLVVRTLADGTTLPDALAWDGRDDAGNLLLNGDYTVSAALLDDGVEVATVDHPLALVRLGVTQGTLGGERISLLWHYAGGAGQYWESGVDGPTFALSSLDLEDGTARPVPAPWDDLYAPPETSTDTNLPAAYAFDAVPTLALTLGGDFASAGLELEIPGWTVDPTAVTPGAVVTFTRAGPLARSVGVVEEDLQLTWKTGDHVVATQSIPLRMYALYGPPTFDDPEIPHRPWVAVVDPLLRAIAGTEPDPAALTSATVEYVYRELDLAYDTRAGASAYTWYRSWNSYDDAVFDLTAFLDRRNGSIVNCSDCASILGAYMNMLGVSLAYAIILQNFDLNYIKAIGGDEFTHCPFGGRGCGFSYHAVTTPDDAATIYDATLALDGDDDPSSSPSTELLVQQIPGDEYLYRLVMDGSVGYYAIQKESIR